MKSILMAAAATFVLAGAPAAIAAEPAAPAAADAAAATNVVKTAKADPRFRTLVKALEAAGLDATLATSESVTVFAPTEEAFAQLPEGTLDNLLKPENREQLRAVLTGHVVPGYATAEFLSGKSGGIETVGGSTLVLDTSDGVTVSGARVVAADVRASNGVIHAIDQVILPAGPVEASAVIETPEAEGSSPE